MNQCPILSYVIDISPHILMAVSLEEKEGENKKETNIYMGVGREREGREKRGRERISIWHWERKPGKSKRLGEASRILKPVFQPFTLLLYKHFEIVRPGTDKSHQAFWFADNPRTNKFHAGITLYSKC